MGGPNWSTANGQAIGWADVNEAEVVEGVRAGVDGGVNHWDNADIYGNGKAERLLAECFRKLGVKRDTQVIATKVGHAKGTAPHAYSPSHIRHQCEQSLSNLRTDYIDIYYFHHGTFVGPGYARDSHPLQTPAAYWDQIYPAKSPDPAAQIRQTRTCTAQEVPASATPAE